MMVESLADITLLRARLRQLKSVVVAFSGGADSAFLAWVANDELGENAIIVTAVSPSLASEEEQHCKKLAHEWGLNWRVVLTNEMANESYTANDGMRCYHCKTALMDALVPIAKEFSATIVLGVNQDDLGDYRPGQQAAQEREAVFPLVDAGFAKADVRSWSRTLGLSTWDKPAAACLSSRLPYGTPVTIGRLAQVAQAEAGLRELGFRHLRVRHYGNTARLEFGPDELNKAIEEREEVVEAIKKAGFSYVTLDLEGLRSGNLNAALAQNAGAVPSA